MNLFTRRKFIPILGTGILGITSISLKNNESKVIPPIKPKYLKEGDTIAICSPAGAMENRDDIYKFKIILESLGLKVRIGENIGKRYGYFSASDEERASEFMNVISDKRINGIFFIRGGWGCARILDLVDFEIIKKNPKVIMGFSDITSLLNAITAKTGLITFHGPGGNSTWNKYSIDYIKSLLFKGEKIKYNNLKSDHPIICFSEGTASGILIGGNLSVLCSLIGSKYLHDWKNKILFLEDIKEEPYRIDRMLTQLKLNRVFDKINGLVLGNFRDCIPKEPKKSFELKEVFEQHFKTFNKPVFYGSQIGHVKNKFTVPIGALVKINSVKGDITLLENCVI